MATEEFLYFSENSHITLSKYFYKQSLNTKQSLGYGALRSMKISFVVQLKAFFVAFASV